MIDVTKQIALFRNFLTVSNSTVDEMMNGHDWDEDTFFRSEWEEMNWNFFLCREFLGKEHTITPLSPDFFAPRDYTVVAVNERELEDVLTEQRFNLQSGWRVYGFATSMKKRQIGFYPPYNLTLVINDITKKTHCFESDDTRYFLKLYTDHLK